MTFDPHAHPDFLDRLDQAVRDHDGTRERGEVRFRCPLPDHADHHPSARWNREKAAWCCEGCGAGGGALALAALLEVEPPPGHTQGGGGGNPSHRHCNGATLPGCTLADYAKAKQLPPDFLRRLGLSDFRHWETPSVRIPYLDPDGREAAVQFRQALQKPADGPDLRFRWKSGSKVLLYGLDRLELARERGEIVIVEGASDCHTLWLHGVPAVGLPGAGNWNEARDAAHLDGIATIYIIIEPDTGGDAVKTWLATSTVRDRVRLVDLSPHKDPSALHVADPDRFLERWERAIAASIAWTDAAAADATQEADAAWATCRDLAEAPDILARMERTLAAAGVAGEARTLKLLYLIVTSRLLPRPISAAIKGPSSGGKSYTLEQVLALFPESAYYALSAMSERALAYGTEPLSHRFLVIYEAAGLAGEFASYLVRSLLSEGRVRYETVEKTKDGLTPRLIEREGPTGLLVTTTATRLHPENETRMLSLAITDTPDQTRAVFLALASDDLAPLDRAPWHALQTWLGHAEHRVAIPYQVALAEGVATVAVRLRRDFGALLGLIRAHAILHQASRDRDHDGRIVATLADYAAVRGLVADLIADGVEATVPASVRETVEVVRAMTGQTDEGGESLRGKAGGDTEPTVSIAALATHLQLDKSGTSRRVRTASDRGYLKNLEEKKGRPAKIALGDPLPEDVAVLPTVEAVAECCSVAGDSEGIDTPPPPETNHDANGNSWQHVQDDDREWVRAPLHDDDGRPRCSDCNGPAPADGMHWCAACRAAVGAVAS